MKRISILLATIMLLAFSSSATKVYQVIVGSYSTQYDAERNCIDNDQIHETWANGQRVYRIIAATFYNLQDAKQYANTMRRNGKKPWVSAADSYMTDIHGDYIAPTQPAPATSSRSSNTSSTVYYVIAASYSTLSEAKEYNISCPDGLEGSVIEGTSHGKKVYRVAVSCYRSKSRAQHDARQTNDFYGRDFWVLPSKGKARIVYYGTALSGDPITLNPD